jgi:hypothetical protein
MRTMLIAVVFSILGLGLSGCIVEEGGYGHHGYGEGYHHGYGWRD